MKNTIYNQEIKLINSEEVNSKNETINEEIKIDQDTISSKQQYINDMNDFTKDFDNETSHGGIYNAIKTKSHKILSVYLFACSIILISIALLMSFDALLNLYHLQILSFLTSLIFIILITTAGILFFQEGKSLAKLNKNVNLKARLEFILQNHAYDSDYTNVTENILENIYINLPTKTKEFRYWLVENSDKYQNSKELITLFSQEFLEELDNKAQKIIADKSLLISSSVSLNNNMFIDLIIIITFNISQMREISKIYNQEYSLISRLLIYKMIIINSLANLVVVHLTNRLLQGIFFNLSTSFITNLVLSLKVGILSINFARIVPVTDAEDQFSMIKILIKKISKDKNEQNKNSYKNNS